MLQMHSLLTEYNTVITYDYEANFVFCCILNMYRVLLIFFKAVFSPFDRVFYSGNKLHSMKWRFIVNN